MALERLTKIGGGALPSLRGDNTTTSQGVCIGVPQVVLKLYQ